MSLPLGTPLHLPDGRTGKIAGVTTWGQYKVQPDNPTPDEVERELKFLIYFERAVIVKEHSMNTVLTDEQMLTIISRHINHDNDDMRVKPMPLARAIEQAVLQSPEIQALRKDAERWRLVRDESELQPRDVFSSAWLCDKGWPDTLEEAIDAAMEKQP